MSVMLALYKDYCYYCQMAAKKKVTFEKKIRLVNKKMATALDDRTFHMALNKVNHFCSLEFPLHHILRLLGDRESTDIERIS